MKEVIKIPAPGVWEAVKRILPEGKKKVVDLGCGEQLSIGHTWQFEEYEIHRCDIVNYSTVPNFKRCDLNYHFPYVDKEFDGIIAVEIMEHLENPRHFFRECKRIAKEFIIITTPNCCSQESKQRFLETGYFKYFDSWKPYGHITPIFPWIIHQICEELGLVIEVETYNNPQQEIYIAKVKP